jgi:two-component system, cell cycle sensor histidine kinase and response regulator CckA
LLHAQKMEAVGQLAAGVAHDFNNLLTVIQGHANLRLSGDHAGDAAKASFQTIRDAAERGASLTRQLLAFSRKQVIQQKTINLNSVLQKVGDMLGRLLGEHITLNLALEPELPCIYADPCSLEQVVMNLALNAKDALPNHGGQLSISTSRVHLTPGECSSSPEATAGNFVRLVVSDTGCGMDPSTKSRIFEPFFTTKEVGKGTGMGLAIVYGIVKQHAGWIEVSSQLGLGSSFTIFLPIREGHEQSSLAPLSPENIQNGHQTILVAEDEPALRELIVAVLESYGYRPLVAASGVEALHLWQKHASSVDLLFTDIVMPEGVSGWQLAERLSSENPDLKIVLTSGYSKELEAGNRKLPANCTFLPKPYRPTQLLQILQQSFAPASDGPQCADRMQAALN